MSLQINKRNNYKIEFDEAFKKVKELKDWKRLEQKFKFRVEKLASKHMNEVINMGCIQFSHLGGGYSGVLCDLSPKDCFPLILSRVKHAVETESSIVVVNKNGTVLFAGLGITFLDYFPDLNAKDISFNLQKRIELYQALYLNDPFYQNMLSQQKAGTLKFGDCFMGMAMSKPGAKAKGYQFGMLFYTLLHGFSGIKTKYYFAEFTHPNTVKYSDKNWRNLKLIKGLDYVVTSKFDLNAFIKKKNDEFYSNNALKIDFTKKHVMLVMHIEMEKAKQFWSLEKISKVLLSSFLKSSKL